MFSDVVGSKGQIIHFSCLSNLNKIFIAPHQIKLDKFHLINYVSTPLTKKIRGLCFFFYIYNVCLNFTLLASTLGYFLSRRRVNFTSP